MHDSYTHSPIPVQPSIKDLEAEIAAVDAESAKIKAEINDLDGWLEEFHRNLEIILGRRDEIEEQLARIKQETRA
jgi:hypothetical protein